MKKGYVGRLLLLLFVTAMGNNLQGAEENQQKEIWCSRIIDFVQKFRNNIFQKALPDYELPECESLSESSYRPIPRNYGLNYGNFSASSKKQLHRRFEARKKSDPDLMVPLKKEKIS